MMRPTPVHWLFLLLCITAGCLFIDCTGGSEVIAQTGGSEVVGKIVREDNVPVAHVEVKALKISARDSAGIIVSDTMEIRTTRTNDTGYFSFTSLPFDEYTLYARYNHDSLVLPYITFSPDSTTRVNLQTIIMKTPGAISGFVTTRGSGLGAPIFCYIAGTSYMAIADPVSGKFTINFLPPDTTYTLTVYGAGYLQQNIASIQVNSGVTSDLPDIVSLAVDPEGPVPTPQGLVVNYNPQQGSATLTWNHVLVSDVKRYIVYMSKGATTTPDTVDDTVFVAAIFSDPGDTLQKTVYFQISALDDNYNESQRGPIDTLDAPPPSWFDITMTFERGEQPAMSDTITVIMHFTSRSRVVSTVKWSTDNRDSVIRQQAFANVKNGVDTLHWQMSNDKKRIYATLTDTAGWSRTDSIDASSLQPINIWKNIDSLQSERRDAGACAVNGKLYVFGGASKQSSVSGEWSLRPLATAEMYDPSTGKWSKITRMKVARQKAAYAVLDGKIYVIGGSSGNTVTKTIEFYDPVADSWTIIDSMDHELVGAAACMFDGKIIITGGMSGTSDSIVIHDSVISYDPSSGEWKSIGSMKTARHMHRAVVIGSSILIIGGLGINEEDIFGVKPVPRTECLFGDEGALCASPITLSHGYYGFGAAVINNKLVVLGGLRGISDKEQPLDNVDIFSTGDAAASGGKEMSVGCEGMAVVGYNGGMYLIGGNTGDASAQILSKAVYVYYP